MARRLRSFAPLAQAQMRACCLQVLLAIAASWVSASFAADSRDDVVSTGAVSAHSTSPPNAAVGNIHGIKLTIPYYFLNSAVQYQGEEVFAAAPKKLVPTYGTEIANFALLLRLSNLEPIRTTKDRVDHYKSTRTANPDYYELWTTIDVIPRLYARDLKGEYNNWKTDVAGWGPYVRDKQLSFGLNREVSVRPIYDPLASHADNINGRYEFYYDDKTWKTFIYCNDRRQLVPPFADISHCVHDFLIDDLQIFAEATYTKKDLPRWREIEAQAKKILYSFVTK